MAIHDGEDTRTVFVVLAGDMAVATFSKDVAATQELVMIGANMDAETVKCSLAMWRDKGRPTALECGVTLTDMTLKKVPTSPLWVCVDCFLVHCNGECGELPEDAPVPLSKFTKEDEITAGMLWEEHAEDCPNRLHFEQHPDMTGRPHECECETQSFSWESCDGCGSPLGGERHAVCAWVYPSESLT